MKSQQKAIYDCLVAHGIDSLTVEGSGGGDSGSIDTLTFTKDGVDLPFKADDEISYLKSIRDWQTKVVMTSEITTTLKASIEDLVYAEVEATGIDWFNNEGGFFAFCLDVKNGDYTLSVDINVMDSSVVHDEEISLSDWIATGKDEVVKSGLEEVLELAV